MVQFNSKKSGSFFILLVILFASGCAQQQTISYSIPDKPDPIEPAVNRKFPSLAQQFKSITRHIKNQFQSDEYENVWEHLFDLYALPEVHNQRVEREKRRYLEHPEYLSIIQERAEPYLFAIVEEIESKGLPGELALLPVIESAFKPNANSSSNAAGLWQFIPSTGRFFGLKQNWWYDGRRDIHASTIVATDYLKDLNETFDGDWMLALASYNAGKGTVGKAIEQNKRRQKPTDYWSLPLSKETRDYVPRLLAVADIFANADKYNIPLRPIPDKKVYETVDVGSQLDLTVAAELADISMSDFLTLNTGFKRWCTAPDGPHRLLIPVEQVETFKQNLARLSKHERMKSDAPANHLHKIQKGETLTLIAKRYGISVKQLRLANNMKNDQIVIGKTLFIPSSTVAINQFLRGQQPTAGQPPLTYVVKHGDNLWGIARKFSVSTREISQWNHIALNDPLRPGQKLLIKRNGGTGIKVASAASNPFRTVNYTVRKGDSLTHISRKFNVPLNDLRKWNGIGANQYLRPGQQLKLFLSNSPTT